MRERLQRQVVVVLVVVVCAGSGAAWHSEPSTSTQATFTQTPLAPLTHAPPTAAPNLLKKTAEARTTQTTHRGELHDSSTNKDTPTPSSTPTLGRPQQQPAHPPPTVPAATTATTTTTTTQPSLPVPLLPRRYDITVEVVDAHNNESFSVRERERDDWAIHELSSHALNVSCIFNTLTGEGYLVEGVKCGRYSVLPHRCFCTNRFCRPYVSLNSLLQYFRGRDIKFSQTVVASEGGVVVAAWRAQEDDMVLEAVYSRTALGDLAPLSFTIRGSGRVFMLPLGPVWLQYRVRSWSLNPAPTAELVATPPGVYCPTHQRKFLPRLTNQFSLTMETVIENLGTIAYESQHYESEEKLVSFRYLPHLHADGMFLLKLPGLSDLTTETYRVIHDFKTGIQYQINEKTKNCSIQGIPVSALDATPAEFQHIRLHHASELISINPNVFIYKGTRVVRGIMCDVWVTERGVRKGQYYTVEVYFSHENWTVEVEVFNKARQVPIAISSYVADADNPDHWNSVVHTFFYQYRDGHPSWKQFDISPCLNRINRLFLLLTLEVSYTEIVHYNLEAAKNSIRRAVAGIAGVSPLRITDLFLSSRQSTGEVDVWFVLLEKPDVTGPVLSPRPQLLMADAYKLLHDITHKHNVSVKLELSPKKKLFVTIKCGSLETTTEALHPNKRHQSLRYLQAGYTAGSMAGLGFSMAILGTCVGIFVGFLLWRRHSSFPYHVAN